MYHATALLLPDGRVLSAGQDSGGLAATARSSPRRTSSAAPVPTITGSPATWRRGGQLPFTSARGGRASRGWSSSRPGSNTHEIDSDQRSVPLAFTASGTTITAQVPASGNLIPPGYYMLFVVNGNGVPCVAPWIRVL